MKNNRNDVVLSPNDKAHRRERSGAFESPTTVARSRSVQRLVSHPMCSGTGNKIVICRKDAKRLMQHRRNRRPLVTGTTYKTEPGLGLVLEPPKCNCRSCKLERQKGQSRKKSYGS